MNSLAEQFREKSQGHADIWECDEYTFVGKCATALQDHQKRNTLSPKVVKMAAQFLRIKFDKKELKGTVDYEVSTAIEEALIYYVNCKGEDV